MIDSLKSSWRNAHLTKHDVKINKFLRFNKKELRFYNIRSAVPNLIIVGSQKCGTSSLHFYLNDHPDIYMSSPIKEPGYFIFNEWARDYWSEKGIALKSKQELKLSHMINDGYVNQRYFGESSTHYTIDDRVEHYNIVSKIKDESPNSKIIYIIRNPFERLISSYYHMVKYWNYPDTIDNYIENETAPIETTRYFKQIKPFIDVFKDDVLLLLFEDLINNTQATLNKTYDFLNIKRHNHDDFQVFNKTSPNDKIKISLDSYKKLEPIFLEEMNQLEEFFKFKLSWDLSKTSWVG